MILPVSSAELSVGPRAPERATQQYRNQLEDAIRAAEYAAARSLDSAAQQKLLQEFVQSVGVKS